MKAKKRFLSILLSLALVLGLMPGMGLTAQAEYPTIYYLDASGTPQSCTDYDAVETSDTWVDWSADWYVVTDEVTITQSITINGNVNLILCDGASLAAGGFRLSSASNSLTIYAGSTQTNIAGTGSLTVNAQNNAFSGATGSERGGTLTINGGVVSLSSTLCAFNMDENGILNINGGSFTASSTEAGFSAIKGTTITVNGGSFEAAGNNQAALYNYDFTKVIVADGLTVKAGDSEASAEDVADISQWGSAQKHPQYWVHIWAAHAHSFTYSLNDAGDTITATCEADGCTLDDGNGNHIATLTIAAPTNLYADGSVHGATLDSEAWTAAGLTVPTIQYKGRNNTSYAESTTAPTNAGDYTASITVESVTASVDFTVEPLPTVDYLDASGTQQSVTEYTVVTSDTTFNTDGVYVVKENVDLTYESLTIEKDVKLIICDGATLNAACNYGVTVSDSGSLTVYGQSGGMGTLDLKESIIINGTLTINGGTVQSVGNGTRIALSGGNVTINGGSLIAGSNSGVGISVQRSESTFTFNGGTVTASGEGGAIRSRGTVTIGNGLRVKAGTSETDYALYSDSADFNTIIANFDADFNNNNYYKWVQIGIFHTHALSNYTLTKTNAENDTITAVCDNADGKCPLKVVGQKNTATLTILASAEGGGAATLTGASDFGVTDANIEYSGDNGSTWTNDAPSGDGFYQARITVGGVTASVSYGVNAISKDAAFAPATAHGDFTVPAVAAVGAAVEITTTPDDGYVLDALTVTKASGDTVTATKNDNTGAFTMPAENVTVSASFVGRDVPIKVTVAGGDEETRTAALLDDAYNVAADAFSKKVGETFILRVSTDEDYDYTVKFGDSMDAATSSMTVFSDADYQAYAAYLESNGITVPAQTELFWVTVPTVAAGDLNIAVTFGKVDSFTVLYQPTAAVGDTDTVWCKFTDSETRVFAAEMTNDLNMNGVTVWSVSLKSAFDPNQIAFVTVSKTADADTLKTAINGAALTACTAQTNTDWKTVSGDKYMVIGGNAKAVAAAFVDGDENAQFEIGVCPTDADGNVTAAGTVKAPAAPVKAGFTFGGWRGFQYDSNGKASEKIYAAGDSVPVRANTTLSTVWTPIVPKIKLDVNDGEGGSNVTEVNYGEKLTIAENPTKNGYAFVDWLVDESVTEDGTFFPEGVPFDFDTAITDDLDLTALWEHVHAYTCVPLNYSGFGDALEDYYDYLPYIHVRFCGCADVKLEAHTFQNGVCTECGYTKPGSTEVQLEVSYWKQGASGEWMNEFPRTVKRNEEVTVEAYYTIGDYQFSKWQYSTDSGATWNDLAATNFVGFIIPCSMKVRAVYASTITQPQIELSANSYVTQEQGYNWDTVLFQMNYKLPDGCTFVDTGVRMGDNDGISYYEMKEYKQSTGQKAAEVGFSFGFNMIPFVGGGLSGFLTDQTMDLISGDDGSQYYYENRENSVLDEMTAATLSDYMMKFKPVNVEKYDPIYWETKAQTKSQCGSVNTLTPLRFIQKNNGNHYIYGMAYLTYKTPAGETETIYTEAIPVTRNSIPSYTVRVTPSGMTH